MASPKDVPAEKLLFDAANQLRGSVESAEYKHLVLGLVFLKYVSDGFDARRRVLDRLTSDPESEWHAQDDEDREAMLEDRDAYAVANVFWVPREARWPELLALGSLPDLGVRLDRALELIERENPALKDVLPKVYARAALSPETLGQLVSTIAKIGFGDDPEVARDVLGRVYEYFIKEFARSEGHRGGEFYTPANLVRPLVEMLQPFSGRIHTAGVVIAVMIGWTVAGCGDRAVETARPEARTGGCAGSDTPGKSATYAYPDIAFARPRGFVQGRRMQADRFSGPMPWYAKVGLFLRGDTQVELDVPERQQAAVGIVGWNGDNRNPSPGMLIQTSGTGCPAGWTAFAGGIAFKGHHCLRLRLTSPTGRTRSVPFGLRKNCVGRPG